MGARGCAPSRGEIVFSPQGAFSSFSVDDIAAARRFYGETLGLEVRGNEMGFLELVPASGGRVLVYPKLGHVPAEFTVLNFPVDDIDAAVDDLRGRGVETKIYDDDQFSSDDRGIVRDDRGPAIAWFRDPAGNVLSVMES
jgi:catechol 2,3-dioxygenase-like lactoylglutathione lyase family enzyme